MGSVVTRDWLLTQLLNPICVGCDIGQLHDPSAIAVCEVQQEHRGKYRTVPHMRKLPYVDEITGRYYAAYEKTKKEPVLESDYTVRHIKRLPLGTSYPDVAIHIADMLCSSLFAKRDVRILIDVTGVGRGVYDILVKEIHLREQTKHMRLQPITFAHGETYNRSIGRLGKAFLVSRLQALLQSSHVHAPKTKEVLAMMEELKVYEIKVSNEGKDTYGAEIGKHDDLATALGLACLEDPFADRVSLSQRVY